MTQNLGPTAGPAPASGIDRFFGWLRSLDVRRDTDDKWLAGVCSGIATRFGVDPLVIRALLVLLVVMGGVGITLYLIAWAFLPNAKHEIVAERAVRDGDVLGIILLVVIGLSLVGGSGIAGDVPGIGWIWWVIVPVGLVLWLVMGNRDGRSQVHSATGHAATYAAQPSTGAPTGAPTSLAVPTAPAAPYAPYGPGPATGPATGTGAGPGVVGHDSPIPPGAPPSPPYGYSPPPPPRAPKPPKAPRRRSGGFVGTMLVGGLALAAYGLTVWAHRANDWGGSDQTVGLCAALAVVGLGAIVLGLAGRRAGFIGFVAVVLALVTWTASVVPDVTFAGGIGERIWSPSATDTTSKYRLSVGAAELDLAQLPDNPGTAREIDAGVGIGELKIFIPENLTVEVHSSVAAGEISRVNPGGFGRIDPPTVDSDPFGSSAGSRDGHEISTVETFGEGTPDVVVKAHVGLGQILIGKE